MCSKKRGNKMDNFSEFLEKNKAKIRKVADSITKKNENGIPVISKDDPWRKEHEWDDLYKELSLTK
jgi:hypothetical protein